MADPKKPETTAAIITGPAWVTVRATRQGFCPGQDSNGRHFFREPGDVFVVEERLFSDEWMLRAKPGDAVPELPPEPPPTTAGNIPRPVTTLS